MFEAFLFGQQSQTLRYGSGGCLALGEELQVSGIYESLRLLGVPYFGVLIIRILLFRVLY